MSYRAGSAYVTVRPDMSGFSDDISGQLSGLDAQAAEAGAGAGAAYGEAFNAAAHTEAPDVADAGAPAAPVTAVAETEEARADLDELTEPRTAVVVADADTGEAELEFDDLGRPRVVPVEADLDDAEIEGEAEELDALLDSVGRDRTAKVGLDDGDLKTGAGVDDALLDDVVKPRTAVVVANTESARTTIASLQLQIDILTAQQKGIDIGADATRAELTIATLQAQLADLQKPKEVSISAPGLDAVSPLILTIAGAVATLGPEAAGAAVGVGLVGAAFGAAASVGGGFTGVLDTLKADLMSGAEQVGGFSSALGETGIASLQDFEGAAADVGDAVGHLFTDFAPEIQDAAKDVEDLAGDFDSWAKSVNASGLDGFLSKVFNSQTISELKGDLSDIVQILKNVGGAIEDISPTALAGLSAALDVLAHIPPGVIAGLIDLFAAMKVASMISGPVTSAVDWVSGLFGGASEAEGAGEAAGAGEEAAAAFIEGFRSGLAGISAVGEEAAAQLADGAPAAGAAGAETGEAYAAGIEGAAAVGALGEEVAGDLASGAAAAGAAGAETGEAYAAGLDGATAAGAVGEEVASELAEGAGAAGAAGTETGAAYAGGVEEGAQAAGAVGDETAAELESGAAAGAAAGDATGTAFAEGVAEGAQAASAVGPEVTSELAEAAGMAEEAGAMV